MTKVLRRKDYSELIATYSKDQVPHSFILLQNSWAHLTKKQALFQGWVYTDE